MNGIVERADREQPRAEQVAGRGPPRPASGKDCFRRCRARCAGLCWCADHFCADAIFALAKTSAISLRRNRPRWLTQAPRLVETVTSGEVVTIRSASAPPALARSSRMRPNAAWVDCSSPAGAGMCRDLDRAERARPLVAGDAAVVDQRLDRRRAHCRRCLRAVPTRGLRATPMASRSAAIWVGFISPA